MAQPIPIQCRCGGLRGTLTQAGALRRGICYCRDCQTYAHALGKPETVLDAMGGTTIVPALQEQVEITQGREHLACMLLTSRGIYRWYAACCRTPIANTTKRPQMPYVGLVHSCLSLPSASVTDRWADPFTVNTAHAKGQVPAPGVKTLVGTLGIVRMVLGSRLRGSWRRTPFFKNGTTQPACAPVVLSAEQLETARRAV